MALDLSSVHRPALTRAGCCKAALGITVSADTGGNVIKIVVYFYDMTSMQEIRSNKVVGNMICSDTT